MPARRMLSHYKVDAENARLLVLSCNAEDLLLPRSHFTFFGNFSTLFSASRINQTPRVLVLNVFFFFGAEYDSSFQLIQKKEYVVPDHLMIHDWAFTDSHYILFANRIRLDIPGKNIIHAHRDRDLGPICF